MVRQFTMTRLKEPNPLNIFGNRKVDFLPEFFDTVDLEQRYNLQDSITRWIDTNLKGRYFVTPRTVVKDGTMQTKLTVGFENQKELSYFMLACPLLKYN